MNPLRVAAWAVQLVCDLFAPVQPERVIVGQHAPKLWPDGEQPLIGEPPTDDDLFAAEAMARTRAMFEPMPGWFRGGFDDEETSAGSTASEAGVDPSAEDGPTPGRAHTPGVGRPKVLRASAIQLEEWSRHIACPASIYCGALARQLREMATSFDNSSK